MVAKRGFALVETLVVILILMMLAVLSVPTFNALTSRVRFERSLLELVALADEAHAETVLLDDPEDLTPWKASSSLKPVGNTTSGSWNASINALSETSKVYGEYSFFMTSPSSPVFSLAMRSLQPDLCVLSVFRSSDYTLMYSKDDPYYDSLGCSALMAQEKLLN